MKQSGAVIFGQGQVQCFKESTSDVSGLGESSQQYTSPQSIKEVPVDDCLAVTSKVSPQGLEMDESLLYTATAGSTITFNNLQKLDYGIGDSRPAPLHPRNPTSQLSARTNLSTGRRSNATDSYKTLGTFCIGSEGGEWLSASGNVACSSQSSPNILREQNEQELSTVSELPLGSSASRKQGNISYTYTAKSGSRSKSPTPSSFIPAMAEPSKIKPNLNIQGHEMSSEASFLKFHDTPQKIRPLTRSIPALPPVSRQPSLQFGRPGNHTLRRMPGFRRDLVGGYVAGDGRVGQVADKGMGFGDLTFG